MSLQDVCICYSPHPGPLSLYLLWLLISLQHVGSTILYVKALSHSIHNDQWPWITPASEYLLHSFFMLILTLPAMILISLACECAVLHPNHFSLQLPWHLIFLQHVSACYSLYFVCILSSFHILPTISLYFPPDCEHLYFFSIQILLTLLAWLWIPL